MIDPTRTIHDWHTLTGSDFNALRGKRIVALVTCSPLEVHGPHLPVAADLREGAALLDGAVEKVAARVPGLVFLRMPDVFAAADVLQHRGSVRFRPGTVVRFLEDLGDSLARQGVADVWVSNFHGGPRHFVAIERACVTTQRRHGSRMVPLFSMLLERLTGGATDLSSVLAERLGIPAERLRGDSHGGAVETALLLHLMGAHVDPGYRDLPADSVELRLARGGKSPLQKGERPTLVEILRGFFHKFRYFEEATYAGDPALATAAVGAQIYDHLTDLAADALCEVLDGRLPPSRWHSPLWPLRHLLLSDAVYAVFERAMATRPRAV
jgi:creatinine amidohydrolase